MKQSLPPRHPTNGRFVKAGQGKQGKATMKSTTGGYKTAPTKLMKKQT